MSESKDSANRVKKFFSDSQHRDTSDEKGKSHDYRLESTPRLPKGIEGISLTPLKPGKKELNSAKVVQDRLSIEQLCCSANQNYPLDYLQKANQFHRRKVKNVRLKEQLIATRNLKKLSYEMQQWIYSQVHQKVEVLGKDRIDLYQLIEKREERHFQLDRIIKYLST